MPIQVSLSRDKEPSSNPILILKNLMFKRLLVGKDEPSHDLIRPGRKIVYFRNKGCTACGLIDMKLMRFCQTRGINIEIINRWPSVGLPTSNSPYVDENGEIMDSDGSIGSIYEVAVYPTLVLVNDRFKIAGRQVGFYKRNLDIFDDYMDAFITQ